MFCLPTEKSCRCSRRSRKVTCSGWCATSRRYRATKSAPRCSACTLLVYAEWFKDTGKDETKALLLKFREDVGPKSPYAEGLTLALKVIGAL